MPIKIKMSIQDLEQTLDSFEGKLSHSTTENHYTLLNHITGEDLLEVYASMLEMSPEIYIQNNIKDASHQHILRCQYEMLCLLDEDGIHRLFDTISSKDKMQSICTSVEETMKDISDIHKVNILKTYRGIFLLPITFQNFCAFIGFVFITNKIWTHKSEIERKVQMLQQLTLSDMNDMYNNLSTHAKRVFILSLSSQIIQAMSRFVSFHVYFVLHMTLVHAILISFPDAGPSGSHAAPSSGSHARAASHTRSFPAGSHAYHAGPPMFIEPEPNIEDLDARIKKIQMERERRQRR